MERKGLILSVDDDPMIRELLRSILVSEGYNVVSATDGLNVFELLEGELSAKEVSLIILDIEMPRMRGTEVLTRLRSAPATKDIPIIMLTAQSGNQDQLQSWYGGADKFLLKPFQPQELLDCIWKFVH